MSKIEVSVIIPAYNEEEYIGPCLQSLVWQKTKHEFEVIVVDNNSTDTTKKVAMSFKDKLNIRVITEKQQGRGMARWRGFEEATGEFLFSSDADTVFPEEWIERFMKYFSNEKTVAVTSLCDIDDTSRRKRAMFKFIQLLSNEGYRIALGHYQLSGFSYAIRRDIYIKAGKIDNTLNALDDLDLGTRVKKFGKIKFVRNMPVLSSNRRFKNGLSRGIISYWKPLIKYSILKKNNFTMDNPR
jgi:glycosyltransferase involved in cell wall biosynthesis